MPRPRTLWVSRPVGTIEIDLNSGVGVNEPNICPTQRFRPLGGRVSNMFLKIRVPTRVAEAWAWGTGSEPLLGSPQRSSVELVVEPESFNFDAGLVGERVWTKVATIVGDRSKGTHHVQDPDDPLSPQREHCLADTAQATSILVCNHIPVLIHDAQRRLRGSVASLSVTPAPSEGSGNHELTRKRSISFSVRFRHATAKGR